MADDTIAHEDIIKMAAECGFPVNWQHPDVRAIKVKRFVDFAALVAATEREACAKVCDEIANKPSNMVLGVALNCASAIRARGQP